MMMPSGYHWLCYCLQSLVFSLEEEPAENDEDEDDDVDNDDNDDVWISTAYATACNALYSSLKNLLRMF